MGVTIRHWFNTQHARKGAPYWTWAATVILMIVIAWLSSIRPETPVEGSAEAPLGKAALVFAAAPGFDDVTSIVQGRCSMCHAAEPSWEGMYWPPKGVVLETPAQIAHEARRIYVQAGLTHAMPPANLSFIEPEERAAIRRWYESAGAAPGI